MQASAEVFAPPAPCPGPVGAMQDQAERCRTCGKCRNVLRLLPIAVGERDPAQPAGRRGTLQAGHLI